MSARSGSSLALLGALGLTGSLALADPPDARSEEPTVPAQRSAQAAAPLPETVGTLDLLEAAGQAFAEELGLILTEIIGTAEQPSPATTWRGPDTYKGWNLELGCTPDSQTIRNPFPESLVYDSFDIELIGSRQREPVQLWLQRPGAPDRVTLGLQSTSDGWAARAPQLEPGLWAILTRTAQGLTLCSAVEVRAGPAPVSQCPAAPTGTRGCEALELLRDARYPELRVLAASLPEGDVETRLLVGAAACALGHEPRDLIPGDTRGCRAIRRDLKR